MRTIALASGSVMFGALVTYPLARRIGESTGRRAVFAWLFNERGDAE